MTNQTRGKRVIRRNQARDYDLVWVTVSGDNTTMTAGSQSDVLLLTPTDWNNVPHGVTLLRTHGVVSYFYSTTQAAVARTSCYTQVSVVPQGATPTLLNAIGAYGDDQDPLFNDLRPIRCDAAGASLSDHIFRFDIKTKRRLSATTDVYLSRLAVNTSCASTYQLRLLLRVP